MSKSHFPPEVYFYIALFFYSIRLLSQLPFINGVYDLAMFLPDLPVKVGLLRSPNKED